jgi:hypothetical protein
MRTMKIGTRIPTTIVILLIFVVILTARGTLDSVDGQTNSTTNQTTVTTATPAMTTSTQDEASQSIRGAITETGEFLGNVTEKVATSKSAGTIVNETSEVLGNATVETQKFFGPDKD